MILNMVGGGGNQLNFKVVGGQVRPTSPKENTIWANSANDVRSWYISPTEPPNVSGSGHFWIKTDDKSQVSMEMLKKNSIIVHPSTAYEYTASGWAERDAQIFQYGTWSDLKTLLYIYNNGNSTGYSFACDTTMKQVSSGYTAFAERVTVGSSSISVATSATVTYDFTNIFVTDASGSFVVVDLSKYTKIRIKGTVSNASKNTDCVFRVLSEMGDLCTENNVASNSFTSGAIDATVDISSIDSACYLGFTFYNGDTAKIITFELAELWLE